MNHGALVSAVRDLECFDLALLVQAFDERRDSILVQLSRLMKAGKVVGLRRGMYTLPEAFRRVPVSPARLANELYRPSCLSGLWALGAHDLIPERVVRLTSVTPRPPRRFENPFGVFDYRSLKREAFFGYAPLGWGEKEVLAAEPEKALLDHWHFVPGEWTVERLAEMRYQNVGRVSAEKLRDHADRFRSPRLRRAASRFLEWTKEEEREEGAEGTDERGMTGPARTGRGTARIVPMKPLRPLQVTAAGSDLAIAWNDGTESYIPLATLRRLCPCAECHGEADLLGHVAKPPARPLTTDSFRIDSTLPVGGYAVQLFWGDGHSDGLFPYRLLKKWGEEPPQLPPLTPLPVLPVR